MYLWLCHLELKKIMESGVCVVIMSGVSFSSLELRWPGIALNSHWCQFVYQSLIRAIMIAIIMDNKRSNLVELDKYWCKCEFSSNKLCEKILYMWNSFFVGFFACVKFILQVFSSCHWQTFILVSLVPFLSFLLPS